LGSRCQLSGSSATPLGIRSTDDSFTLVLVVIEALIGLGLLGVVISYLPTVYNAYLDREIAVARLGLASELRRIAHGSDGVPAYRTG